MVTYVSVGFFDFFKIIFLFCFVFTLLGFSELMDLRWIVLHRFGERISHHLFFMLNFFLFSSGTRMASMLALPSLERSSAPSGREQR